MTYGLANCQPRRLNIAYIVEHQARNGNHPYIFIALNRCEWSQLLFQPRAVAAKWPRNEGNEALRIVGFAALSFTEGGEIDHFDLTLQTKNENNANYEVSLSIISDALAGSFSTTGETLSLWSSVNYGTTYSYCTGGSVVTINAKGNGVYTISANLLCENGYTYKLNAFDFSYQGIVTGVQNTEYKVQTQKAFRDGQIIIIRDGKEFNAQGASL